MFFINPFIYAAGADFESIATVTVGSSGASSIEFTSIPGTYQHLQIRYIADTDMSGNIQTIKVEMNGDTASNYRGHELVGSGASASASAVTFAMSGLAGGTQYSANVFSGGVIDILDYASSSKTTVVRSLSGLDSNGSGYVGIQSGLWTSTNTVTSLKFYPQIGNFLQYSQAALYGIKAP